VLSFLHHSPRPSRRPGQVALSRGDAPSRPLAVRCRIFDLTIVDDSNEPLRRRRSASSQDNPSVSRTCADSERTEIFLAKSTPVEIGRANNSFGVMPATAGRPIDLSRLLS